MDPKFIFSVLIIGFLLAGCLGQEPAPNATTNVQPSMEESMQDDHSMPGTSMNETDAGPGVMGQMNDSMDDTPMNVTGEAMPGTMMNESEGMVGPKRVEINMTAKQWEFVPGTVTVNKGDTVILHITSTDVAHGIGMPQFGVSEDLPPGETVTVTFVADKEGTYTFFCNVYCGSGHREMKGTLVVK